MLVSPEILRLLKVESRGLPDWLNVMKLRWLASFLDLSNGLSLKQTQHRISLKPFRYSELNAQ